MFVTAGTYMYNVIALIVMFYIFLDPVWTNRIRSRLWSNLQSQAKSSSNRWNTPKLLCESDESNLWLQVAEDNVQVDKQYAIIV